MKLIKAGSMLAGKITWASEPKFRDLKLGDTFDFISPTPMLNSFYARCVKLSTRTYNTIEGKQQPPMRIGSINANVYHVNSGPRKAFNDILGIFWTGCPAIAANYGFCYIAFF